MMSHSRRAVLVGATALAACRPGSPADEGKTGGGRPRTIEAAVAGDWRPPVDRARDAWRHPVESLQFWGLEPGQTVVEFWPGTGWYTDILAPFLAARRGKLYAAHFQVAESSDPAGQGVVEDYRRRLARNPHLYGKVEITVFGPISGPVAPVRSADLALFLRNLHNWMTAGIAEKAFRDAFLALKPGGVLGIVEHRAKPGAVPDLLAVNGYVDQVYVKSLAQEAGFEFADASEINANPKDTRDHPFGVWTLPPVRRSSPRGEPDDHDFDHSAYDAIGESDRMTLKFIKPA